MPLGKNPNFKGPRVYNNKYIIFIKLKIPYYYIIFKRLKNSIPFNKREVHLH